MFLLADHNYKTIKHFFKCSINVQLLCQLLLSFYGIICNKKFKLFFLKIYFSFLIITKETCVHFVKTQCGLY